MTEMIERSREAVLTPEEAAVELGVSKAVIYANVKAGIIPKVPMSGRLIRIPRSKFEQYKRGELDDKGEPKLRPTQTQLEMLKGTQSILRRR